MINAVIVDDEYKLIEVLKYKLNKFCPNVNVVGEALNVAEAYSIICAHSVDLVFLDIAMSGETGFDLLNKFESIDFEIIFITGFSEYAMEALKLSAIDYILKPAENEELISAVARVFERLNERQIIANYSILKHNLQNINSQNAKIVIPGIESHKFVNVSDVVWIEGWEKYTKIHLNNGEILISSYNLGVFGNMTKNYGFFKTHRSHIVNESYISEFFNEGTILLTNGDHVPISKRKKAEFVQKFLNKP